MSNLIPLDGQLPAHLQQSNAAEINNALTGGLSTGYPVLSIKGKTFAIMQDGDRRIITKPDDDDEPAQSLEVVILDANPKFSKVYYAAEFEEGVNASPDCMSMNGITPDASIESPVASKCAACPKNEWGSGRNGRGKACSDSRRLAVAPAGQVNEPLLLRVPPASLKPLQEYGQYLANRKVAFDAVVTKIRFDPSEASPKLIFKAVGFLPADQYAEVQEAKQAEVIHQITGRADAPALAKPAAPKPAKVTKHEAEEDDSDQIFEEEEAPKPVKKAAKPKPAPEPVVEDDDGDDDLDSLLAEFDD